MVALIRIDDQVIMAADAQAPQELFQLMSRGWLARDRLAAVLGLRPPDLDGAGDMAQVIFGLVSEIDDAQVRVFLIDQRLQLFGLDQNPGMSVISRGAPPARCGSRARASQARNRTTGISKGNHLLCQLSDIQ